MTEISPLKIIKKFSKMNPKNRKVIWLWIFFILVDYFAGYYAIFILNRMWLMDLEMPKIILFSSMISFLAFVPVLLYFISDSTEAEFEKSIYKALVGDTVCWSWSAGVYILGWLVNKNLVPIWTDIMSKAWFMVFCYGISFIVLIYAIKHDDKKQQNLTDVSRK